MGNIKKPQSVASLGNLTSGDRILHNDNVLQLIFNLRNLIILLKWILEILKLTYNIVKFMKSNESYGHLEI